MKEFLRWIFERWNEFFFKPISPASLGVFRIAFAFVVFISMLGKFPHRELFYGDLGLVSEATMRKFLPGPDWFYFLWVPGADPALMWYFLGILVASLALMVGFCTRLSSILVFLGIITLSNRNFFVDNAGDDLLRMNAFFLMFSHAGAAYSVDRWLRVRKGLESAVLVPKPPWGQRLLQLQLAFLYLNTAYLKLPGQEWLDGTALYYALNYIELRRFQFPFLYYYLWQIKAITILALAAEFAAGSLIWFRRFRYPALIAAFLLHWMINLMMQFPVFQYVMMASLINFIYPEDVERFLARIRDKLRMLADRLLKRGSSV